MDQTSISPEKVIQLLEEQLTYVKEQNKELSKQIEVLTNQVRHLTKLLYGSKSEKSKYQVPDGQCSLFDDDDFFYESEHTEEQSTDTVTYTVVRNLHKKKRNNSFLEGLEIEEIHHHPEHLQCRCCHSPMTEIGSTVVREEAKFIPAVVKRVRHIEHAYECRNCKKDLSKNSQIKRGKAPQPAIQRSIAGPTVLAKLIYDKFVQYLPLYRQVKEWNRYGLLTNDKNLSNWVIRIAEDWLLPIYHRMKEFLMKKSILHIDETYVQILKRSDGKSAQSNAYNWVFRSVAYQGPIIVMFHSALSRSREVLKDFVEKFKGTIICDGYSAYAGLPNVTFANCWAHVRRKWLKADSKNGEKGVEYCNRLYKLERKFKHLSPSKRRKARKKYSKPIVEEFLRWVDESPFYGRSALAEAANYTLKHAEGLKAFLNDGRIAIDNNPAENAIRPNVIGRKNWLFSVSELGAEANAICLSLAETAKANGIDFYQYLVKVLTELPNLPIHQQPEIIDRYLPWNKNIRETCAIAT
ncbi:IS66 family transposase [Calidifontibacillus erzurumensis]|uniref:IS66 family transposase n=1 Tax=Calidifontibacillus erzurumensis TaxID=2741433 RepID=A0A8J8KCM1_9BACI|nr:IS66 family transposase [Calidifontibacillus erzurumensis]